MNKVDNIIKINTKNLMDDLFDGLFKLQKNGDHVFRGISNDKHFSPTLFREFREKMPNAPSAKVWDYEEKLLEKFGRYSIQYLPSITSPLDWVASAQHFGLPTRLLDWTFNPFFGLFFSVFYNQCPNDDNYQLLVINLKNHIYEPVVETYNQTPFFGRSKYTYLPLKQYLDFINEKLKEMGFKEQEEQSILNDFNDINLNDMDSKPMEDLGNANYAQEMQNDKRNARASRKLYFCSVNHSNPRIVAQSGLFQIPFTFGHGIEKGWIKEDIENGCESIYKIHKDLRPKILTVLNNMNINSIRLFPDLQNICDYIRRTTCYNTDEINEGTQS